MMAKDSNAPKNVEFSRYNASSTTHCEKDIVLNLREKLESMETKLQQEVSHCQRLEDEKNLYQKPAATPAAQERWETAEGRLKQLEEKILSLKTHIDKDMIEHSEVEKSKKSIEEQHRSQVVEKINKVNQLLQEEAASDKQKEQARQDYIMSMEQRFKDIEAEMVEIKFRTLSTNTELRIHKKSYRAELKTEELLKYELENISSTHVKVQHTNSRVVSGKRMNRKSHISTHHKSASGGACDRTLQNDLGFSRTGAPVEGHSLSPRSRRKAWWDSLRAIIPLMMALLSHPNDQYDTVTVAGYTRFYEKERKEAEVKTRFTERDAVQGKFCKNIQLRKGKALFLLSFFRARDNEVHRQMLPLKIEAHSYHDS